MRIDALTNLDGGEFQLNLVDKWRPHRIYFTSDAYSINGLLLSEEEINYRDFLYRDYVNIQLGDSLNINSVTEDYIEGTTLYLSHFYENNYSHFTLNCLPAYFHAKYLGILPTKINIFIPCTKPFHRQAIELFNLDKYNIISPHKDTLYRFENLIYSNCNFLTGGIKGGIYNIVSESTKDFCASPTHIYITRINNQNRRAINESQVIDFFKSYGFEIVDFDNLCIKDQISLINGAETICAAHGASGANLIYRNLKQFKLIEYFNYNHISTIHAHILQAKNCSYTPVVFRGLTMKSTYSDHPPFEVDLSLLERALSHTSKRFVSGNIQIESYKKTDYEYKINNLMSNDLKAACLARESFISGEQDLAVKLYGSIDYTKLRRRHIPLFLIATFLNLDFEERAKKFYKLEKTLFYADRDLFLRFAVLDFDLQKLTSFLSQFHNILPENTIKMIQTDVDYLTRLRSNPCLSWFKTQLGLQKEQSFIKLIHHREPPIEVILSFSIDSVYFFIPSLNSYIAKIFADNKVLLSPNKIGFEAIFNNEKNFSIKVDDKYLSAEPSGSFSLKPVNREWERFFIKTLAYEG